MLAETTMTTLVPPSPSTLPERLRRGDAAALLEIAHATHGRALAVVRAAGWSERRSGEEGWGTDTDPEGLLLDAYVALYFRRADVPDDGAEAWALAEVLAYCERRAALDGRGTGGGGRRRGTLGARVRGAVQSAVHTLVHAVAHAAGRDYPRPSTCGGSVG
jgi:hypothetical protein